MTPDEYRKHDAVGLAELVAKGEVTAAELLEAAIARMEAVNGQVNAVVQQYLDYARAVAAQAPSGALGGVPFLLKDLGALMEGTVTTAGSRLMADLVQPADSAIVAAYKRAGLVIFGKTNTPEFGLMPVTEPALFGPSRNPWDLERTPGGSSGGASAAVAAGIVPAAHASDGGGSIRTPASTCGLVGLKPSRGRVSFAPNGEGWGGLSVQHAVTRSVRDCAALLDIVCHPQPGDPYYLSPPAEPYQALAGRAPGKLSIAFSTAALASPHPIEPECAEAVRAAARLCENLGHMVEEADPPYDAGVGVAGGYCTGAGTAAGLDTEAARRGRPIEQGEVEPLTWAMYQRGKAIAGTDYVRGLSTVHAYGRQMAAFHQRFDVLIMSTLGTPAIPIGHLTETGRGEDYAERLFAFMPNTQAFNISGQPAITLPLAWSRSGLPIGVQFVAPIGAEAVLLQLAAQLEQAQPWFDRIAPL